MANVQSLHELRALAVATVLQQEVNSGHMLPLLAQNLVRRMDVIYTQLLEAQQAAILADNEAVMAEAEAAVEAEVSAPPAPNTEEPRDEAEYRKQVRAIAEEGNA